jgi:hypothetical protein
LITASALPYLTAVTVKDLDPWLAMLLPYAHGLPFASLLGLSLRASQNFSSEVSIKGSFSEWKEILRTLFIT